MSRPKVILSTELRAALDHRRAGLASEVQAWLDARVRPCALLRSTRCAPHPLRRSPLIRLLGGSISAPTLSPLVSKWGGAPYGEAGEDWAGHRFLGQIDLSEASDVLPELGVRGLLRLDVPESAVENGALRARWFAAPSLDRLSVPPGVESVGAWECRIALERSWTLPETTQDFFRHFPAEVREAWLDVGQPPEGFERDDLEGLHRLGGWAASGLDEPYFFEPPQGAPKDITDYEMLLRVTYDNQAGFAWGTNWIYLLVPRGDLENGDLSRLTVTAANY